MNVAAAKCRITANSYGLPISPDGTLNLSDYQDAIATFNQSINDGRQRRSRRYSYNSYNSDSTGSDNWKLGSTYNTYRGWPENRIPWGKVKSKTISTENGRKRDRVSIVNKKIIGRPQSSPSTGRRPFKHEGFQHSKLTEARECRLGGGSIRLIYQRPPAPAPPVDKVSDATVRSAIIPQSLVIVLGKTTPAMNKQTNSTIKEVTNECPKHKTKSKLPSYYLGDSNSMSSELGNNFHTQWSPSFPMNANNNDPFDNCGGYPKFGVGY